MHLVFDCQMHFNEFKLQCDSDSLDHLLINAAMVCPLYIDWRQRHWVGYYLIVSDHTNQFQFQYCSTIFQAPAHAPYRHCRHSSAWVSSVQLLKLFNRVRDSSSFRLSLNHLYAYYSYKFLYVESCYSFIYINYRCSYYNNRSCYALVLCKFKYVMYLVIIKLFHYRNQFSSLFIQFNYACVSFLPLFVMFWFVFLPVHHQSTSSIKPTINTKR